MTDLQFAQVCIMGALAIMLLIAILVAQIGGRS